ncbi:uncharacterized protein DUF2510 [Microterricola gilva]|uniref:Uncharacterized protein DUF2510 n=1 Tax=Microterricola gilva TaxID=393267 RepID=A0A4Q8AQG9_9MICO|nr:DUF2510 domain-containing protein [Microterricola gilva]RZU66934.1 uncharacterized protein DUF2510 [Microterricola gilva]
MTTNGLPSAGWYADPQDAAQLRWWDGARWSDHTAPVPEPVAPAAPVFAGPLPTVPKYGEMAPAAQPVGAQPGTAEPVAAQPFVAPSYAPSAPSYSAQPYPAQPISRQYAGQPYAAQPYGMTMTQGRVPDGTPTANWLIWAYTLLPLLSVLTLFAWDFEGYMLASMTDPAASTMMMLDPGYLLLSVGSWVIAAGMIVLAVLDWRWLGQQGYSRRFHWAWAILSNLVYVIGRCVVVNRQAGRGFAPMWATLAVSVLSLVLVIVWFMQMMNVIMAMVSTTPGIAS